jgi:hypothetical protein
MFSWHFTAERVQYIPAGLIRIDEAKAQLLKDKFVAFSVDLVADE